MQGTRWLGAIAMFYVYLMLAIYSVFFAAVCFDSINAPFAFAAKLRVLVEDLVEAAETNENLLVLVKDRDCYLAYQAPRLQQWNIAHLSTEGDTLTEEERKQCRQWPEDGTVFNGEETIGP